MTTKADAFWKALDDLSPEDRESIGNAARAMLDDVVDRVAEAVRDEGFAREVSVPDRWAMGAAGGRAVLELVRP